MATYTLKTSGIATNLIHCLGVENGVVKDFTGNSTITGWVDDSDVATSSSVGSAQWRSATSNSSSHEYFVTSGNARPKFGTQPTFGLGTSRSLFIAFQDSGGNSGEALNQNRYIIGSGTLSYARGANYGGVFICAINSGTIAIGPTVNLDYAFTGQKDFLFSTTGAGGNGSLYLDGSIDSGASITSNNVLNTFQSPYIGCRETRANAFVGRIYLIAQFDTDISASAASLSADWFGTLFDVSAGTSVAPLAMGSFMRMRNS